MSRFTHYLRYQKQDGSWRDGYLAFTKREARDTAKEARRRTGCKVKVCKLKND